MGELGIDLGLNRPKNVAIYLDKSFDFVITVCGGAKESCPAFSGKVKKHLHIGFDDPAEAIGTEEEIYHSFRRVRDEIKREFGSFNFDPSASSGTGDTPALPIAIDKHISTSRKIKNL